VLDAVQVAGRWISEHVLARLTKRSVSDNPPTRHSLVQDFCRAVNWRNRKGELSLSSASVALNRLEKQGKVRLTPPLSCGSRTRPRKLRDDKEKLPALPRLSASTEITLQLIQGQEDPDHPLWNRLIIREHPLKDAPMVGRQLRYLIRCPQGVIGAFGVGPPAFHLDCRDTWIGWDFPTRQANLSQVIGLSRFLIRPGIRSPNLASRCYGLLLKRIAGDWQERYGIKPVLIETFVDRNTQTGVSLVAANWRRLGQSSGRGRSSPSARVHLSSVKDVWIYELESQARRSLLHKTEPLIVPRSIFQGQESVPWTQQEFDGLSLGERRLEKRLPELLNSRWQHPQRSFGRSFKSAAETKAAYRLIESPKAGITFENLLAPHQHQTQRRMAAESVVLLAQDTTTLSYNTLHETRGLGRVGDNRNPGRGLLLHSLQAFRTDGIPLGNAWAKLWARCSESDTRERNQQSLSEKESVRWIEAYQAAARMARRMPQTHLIVSGDRESDIFELFDQAEDAPENLHLLVRAQHDRLLSSGEKLWQNLWQQPVQGTMRVRVPRREHHPARVATLELRWTAIEMAAPQVTVKRRWKAIGLYAVFAQEIDPPAGVEPIHWVLLTDWKVKTLKMARRMIKWYALRWGIECWHQILKDVCGIERRQMKSNAALERALVLDMIVAWRAQLFVRLGKEHPALPASLFYSEQELAVLEDYKKKLPKHAQSQEASSAATEPAIRRQKKGPKAPSKPAWTLFQANLMVAMLAGFWGRKGDGHPGPKVLAEGLMILAALVEDRRIVGNSPAKPPPRPSRPREPG
jgi:hypothetical protein